MDPPSAKRRRVTGSQVGEDFNASSDSRDDVDDHESPRRASYKAPTRASIAKHNPGLLAGRDNLTTGDIQTEYATSSLRGPRRGLNPTALRPKMTAPRLSASPTRETSSSPSRRARTSQGSLPSRNMLSGPADSQTAQMIQDNQQEEAGSQDGPEHERSLLEEENLAASVIKRSKRGRQIQSGLVADRQETEPDLPPTPVQLGLQSNPRLRAGLSSSSPQGKPSPRKVVHKTSPLKPRLSPSDNARPEESERSREDNLPDPQTSEKAAKDAPVDDEDTIEDDPEIRERTRRLNQFQKQLEAVRSEVSFLQSQVIYSQEKPDQGISSGQLSRLVNVLTTSSQSDQDESSPLKPTSLATRLSSFLPFARRPLPVPQDPLLTEAILPSYKPIEGPNPLVHLQAFSELSAVSTQQLVVAESDGALLIQHQLRLSAPAPMDLGIDLVLLSDTDTESIELLTLQSISPWADSELGSWIRQQAEDTADMAVIGWGCSRYLQLAKARASCWKRCRENYPQHMSDRSVSSMQPASDADDGLDIEALSPYLGKISLQLQSPATKATLQFSWHIDLDWIGDTESRISAAAMFPSKWREKDIQRNSLSKIPETFQLLITKVGVFEAIKVLVSLVLGPE